MKKRSTLFLSIIMTLIVVAVVFFIYAMCHKIKFNHLYNQIKVEEEKVLFIGRPTCYFCSLLKPILDKTSKEYGIKYEYIDTDWLTKKELDKVLKKLDIEKESFSTPRIYITKDKKIMDYNIGYIDDLQLFSFFKRNHLIKEEILFQNPYPNIERITSKNYFDLLTEQKSFEVLVGRIGEELTDAVLKKANEKNKDIKYFNPSYIIGDEENMKFLETFETVNDNPSIPFILKIKEGVVVEVKEITKTNIEQIISR